MAKETRRLPAQDAVSKFYNSTKIQVFVAVLIGANFLTNIIEKEIDPKGNKYDDIFGAFGIFYNVAFTIELVINIYAHWWYTFWKSGWNIFDFIVVSIGIINMAQLPLPPAFSMLRMMRAFRVFRLFKRVRSLNKIIVAIVHAVPGVLNAFLILFIVMSLYAILAVEFYTHLAEDCNEPGGDKNFLTGRGNCMGPEYFGTFSRSLYTFFQVLTGESWSEWVARPAVWFYYTDVIKAVGGCLFFVSYVLVTGFMLINVVVAVLLDKMSDAEEPEDAAAKEEEEAVPAVEDGKDNNATTTSNGVNGLATDDKRLEQIAAIAAKVAQLNSDRCQLKTDLDGFKNDMGDLKAKLAIVLKLIPS